jgi:hypothetical protein
MSQSYITPRDPIAENLLSLLTMEMPLGKARKSCYFPIKSWWSKRAKHNDDNNRPSNFENVYALTQWSLVCLFKKIKGKMTKLFSVINTKAQRSLYLLKGLILEGSIIEWGYQYSIAKIWDSVAFDCICFINHRRCYQVQDCFSDLRG